MSARSNVTSNMLGLSNTLGLDKQAAQLLRASIKHFTPAAETIRSMQRIVAKAPRARRGALSPTKMVSYITNNSSKLPGFSKVSPSERFAELVRDKAYRAANMADKALMRYAARISSGEVDALDPATLKRMQQLSDRKRSILDAAAHTHDNFATLKEMNKYKFRWS